MEQASRSLERIRVQALKKPSWVHLRRETSQRSISEEGEYGELESYSVHPDMEMEPTDLLSSAQNNPTSHEHEVLNQRMISKASNPLARIKDIITDAHGRIQRESQALLKSVEESKIMGMEPLKERLMTCLRAGRALEESLKRDQSSLAEFRSVGDMITANVSEIQQILQKVRYFTGLNQHRWRRRPSKENELPNELPHAAIKLEKTLQELRPIIEILNLSFQASVSPAEKTPPSYSERTSAQQYSPRRRSTGKLTLHSNSSSQYVQFKGDSVPSTFESQYLEVLAYVPFRMFQDVPKAYFKRHHEHRRTYSSANATSWLIGSVEFEDWISRSGQTLFVCEGPRGTGKTILAAAAIDWLLNNQFQCAYFYLGIGKVQTAMGLALAILAQLSTISGYSPFFLNEERSVKQLKVAFDSRNTEDGAVSITTGQSSSSSRPRSGIFFGNMKTTASRATIPINASPEMEPPQPITVSKANFDVVISRSTTGSSLAEASKLGPVSVPESQSSYSGRKDDNATDLKSDKVGIQEDQGHGTLNRTDMLAWEQKITRPSPQNVPIPLHTVIQALREACGRLEEEPFVVLDGWDEENMIDPKSFDAVVAALKNNGCKIFLTSRSKSRSFDGLDVVRVSLRRQSDLGPRRTDIANYVKGLLAKNPDTGSQMKADDKLSKVVTELSGGVFDVAKIIARTYLCANGGSWAFSQTIQNVQSQILVGTIFARGLKYVRRSGKGTAANLLMIWLLLTPFPLTATMLKRDLNRVYRCWNLLFERDRFGNEEAKADVDKHEIQNSNETIPGDIDFDVVTDQCEPFLTTDHGNDLVRFTSLEFEDLAREFNEPREELEVAVAVVFACLNFLDGAEVVDQGCQVTEEALMEVLRDHPFICQAAHLPIYLGRLGNQEFHGLTELEERVAALVNSPKALLLLQAFFFLRQDRSDEIRGTSWDEFVSIINSMTNLHVAALWGQSKLVEILLQQEGQSATSTNCRGSTPLHEAAKSGVASVIAALLAADPGVAHILDNQGKTPLFYACDGNFRDAVVMLFEAQCTAASPEGRSDTNNGTGLNYALSKYCRAKCNFVEDVDEAHVLGVTLVRTIEDGLYGVARNLLRNGADPNMVIEGTSALYSAVEQNNDNLAELLIAKGAHPMVKVSEEKEPILHVAVMSRMVLTVHKLVGSRKLDINCKNSKGRTALFAALESGDEDWAIFVMGLLLKFGLAIDTQDNDGNHVMHVAAEKGYTELYSELMLASRTFEEPKNNAGKTPFDVAKDWNQEELLNFIRPTYRLSRAS